MITPSCYDFTISLGQLEAVDEPWLLDVDERTGAIISKGFFERQRAKASHFLDGDRCANNASNDLVVKLWRYHIRRESSDGTSTGHEAMHRLAGMWLAETTTAGSWKKHVHSFYELCRRAINDARPALKTLRKTGNDIDELQSRVTVSSLSQAIHTIGDITRVRIPKVDSDLIPDGLKITAESLVSRQQRVLQTAEEAALQQLIAQREEFDAISSLADRLHTDGSGDSDEAHDNIATQLENLLQQVDDSIKECQTADEDARVHDEIRPALDQLRSDIVSKQNVVAAERQTHAEPPRNLALQRLFDDHIAEWVDKAKVHPNGIHAIIPQDPQGRQILRAASEWGVYGILVTKEGEVLCRTSAKSLGNIPEDRVFRAIVGKEEPQTYIWTKGSDQEPLEDRSQIDQCQQWFRQEKRKSDYQGEYRELMETLPKFDWEGLEADLNQEAADDPNFEGPQADLWRHLKGIRERFENGSLGKEDIAIIQEAAGYFQFVARETRIHRFFALLSNLYEPDPDNYSVAAVRDSLERWCIINKQPAIDTVQFGARFEEIAQLRNVPALQAANFKELIAQNKEHWVELAKQSPHGKVLINRHTPEGQKLIESSHGSSLANVYGVRAILVDRTGRLFSRYVADTERVGEGGFKSIFPVKEHTSGKLYAWVVIKGRRATELNPLTAYNGNAMKALRLLVEANKGKDLAFNLTDAFVLYGQNRGVNVGDLYPDGSASDKRARTGVPVLKGPAIVRLASSLALLHADGLVHRDINLDNILMNGDIADFNDFDSLQLYGSSALSDTFGRSGFVPPDHIFGQFRQIPSQSLPKADVFAFATTCLEDRGLAAYSKGILSDWWNLSNYHKRLLEIAPGIDGLSDELITKIGNTANWEAFGALFKTLDAADQALIENSFIGKLQQDHLAKKPAPGDGVDLYEYLLLLWEATQPDVSQRLDAATFYARLMNLQADQLPQ